MLKKLAILFLFCFCLTGCRGTETWGSTALSSDSEPGKFSAQIFAMNTVMDISLYGNDDSLLSDASALVNDLEGLFSATDKNSEISRLNASGTLNLSDDTYNLVERALEICRQTDGALDLSIYPVVKAWGFTTDSHHVPSQQELDDLLSKVDYNKIECSPENNSISIPDGMEIDLGSVAKGYTGDKILDLFRKNGITSALLNLGGNVQALGSKPDGTDWRVGVRDPLSNGYLGVLSISDMSVITSGGYERYFEDKEGNIYWHIIDPSTGFPAKNGIISATAVGNEGTYCDALSTSLFIMGTDKAVEFWKTYRDFEMILVTEDEEVMITPGLKDKFTLTDGSSYKLTVIEDD